MHNSNQMFQRLNTVLGPWLFYVGLALVLLNINYLWLTDDVPETVPQFRNFLSQTGKGLLYLRLLLLCAHHPRFVAGYVVLRLFLAFTLASGGDYFINIFALIVAASRDTDIRVALRIYLDVFVFYLLTSFGCYALGWSEDIKRHRWALTGHSFGMVNPAILAAVLLMLSMLTMLLSKARCLLTICTVCIVVSVVVFFLTLRLTETLVLLTIPFLYAAFQKCQSLHRWLPLLPVALLLLSVALACFYSPGTESSTFESRFSTARLAFERHGLSIFGQDCGLVNFNTAWKYHIPPFALDNGYMRLFLRNGVVMGTFIMVVWSFLFFRIGKMNHPLLSAIAVAVAIVGMMEPWAFGAYYNFLCLFVLYGFRGFSAKFWRMTAVPALALTVITLIWLYAPWGVQPTYSCPNGRLGDVPPPNGFVRIEGTDTGFAAYLRSLPLSDEDSVVRVFDGARNDSLQPYCYRVIDIPLLGKDEQCADMCMRLRADYLFSKRRFFRIRFEDTQHHWLRYKYGFNRPALNQYLKDVYKVANTESMKASMHLRQVSDMQPGDVFVYDAKSRPSSHYGHAMLVADVAVNSVTGQKAFLLIQGSTPASSLHLVRNVTQPDVSPWFFLDKKNADEKSCVVTSDSVPAQLDFGVARYSPNELHYFE